MSVILILIGFSLIIAIGFLMAYIWAVKSGQYDDNYTPSVRILFDNDKTGQEKDDDNKNHK
ncbi:MAG: cbb3-type cytochrome oxidase assembly protein CcoS [Melioribacteraceae bacterium]|nr:cbb3-type cytochrome oxidase assembly protein CcoS [Melioribacteraceae bacterium]